MKKILLLGVTLAMLASCNGTKNVITPEPTITVHTDTTAEPPAPPIIRAPTKAVKPAPKVKTMLVGKEDRMALEQQPFASWFNTNYSQYNVQQDQIADIRQQLDGVTITTFMGTWCGDSKRETPRIFKILDEASFKNDDLELITVDRTKKNPTEYTDGHNIIRVPTFIFKKDGKEIGRIVERPVETLEADILKILNGEPYKHSYEK